MNHDRVHFAYHGIEVDPETRALTRNRLHWILDHLPAGRILDLGCSQGTLAILAARRGDQVTGVDVEEEAVAFAAGLAAELPADLRLTFLRGEGEDLAFRDGSFDAAASGELLEHVQDPAAVLTELHRVLAPGGTLVLTVPYGLMPHHDHHRTFYRSSLLRLVEPLFEVREVTTLDRHLAAVAVRRDDPRPVPAFVLSAEERDFLLREERLEQQLHTLRDRLERANGLYRDVTAANTELKAGLRAAEHLSDRITDLATQRGELQERLLATRMDRDRLAAELLSQVDAAALERNLLVSQVDAAAIERDRLVSEAHTAEVERERLQEAVGELTAQRDELRGLVRAVESAHADELRALRDRIAEDRTALARLRTVYNGERHRHTLTQQRLSKLSTAESQLQQDNERLRARLGTVTGRLADYREQVARIRASRGWRMLSVYRRLRHPGRRPEEEQEVVRPAAQPPLVVETPPVADPAPLEEFQSGLRAWIERARAAEGDEVVLMFSGTTFVQEARGNRPIRLTRVYLGRDCPVFFNYYRWRATEPLPSHPDPLLYQSPIDITPKLLDEVLRADFGGKRKLLFASFPHEIMVRTLTHAASHGWVTVYDARDDWEEFAKVGMAKWYHHGHERYLAAHADVVTAVSAPLARKMETLGGRQVSVNANALDPAFPLPSGPRRPDSLRIGYFGHLTDKWFDWELVLRAARTYPQYTFELAGHQNPDLRLPPNVRLLGLLGHRELAELSAGWALALIPFKNGALADAVDPIKVYEYLHLGLPVLTTYFPQCVGYPGVRVTESAAEFVAAIPAVAGSAVDAGVWLADNTWERRVDAYSEMAELVVRKGREGLLTLLESR